MKILESQVSYKLSVSLSSEEHRRYYEAFRSRRPVEVPELENKTFIIHEINIYYFLETEGDDIRLCFLQIQQCKAERDKSIYSVLSR